MGELGRCESGPGDLKTENELILIFVIDSLYHAEEFGL